MDVNNTDIDCSEYYIIIVTNHEIWKSVIILYR